MMRIKKSLVVLLALITVVSVVALSACDRGVKLNGKYELVSVESSGIVLTSEDLTAYGLQMTMEFSGSKVLVSRGDGEDASGKYSVDGDTLTISDAGDTQLVCELSDDNNTITIFDEASGTSMVLEKV